MLYVYTAHLTMHDRYSIFLAFDPPTQTTITPITGLILSDSMIEVQIIAIGIIKGYFKSHQ